MIARGRDSGKGLGCVKTLPWGIRLTCFSAFEGFQLKPASLATCGDRVSELNRAFGCRLGHRARYAPIAAISGLTPTMFITRVRL